MAKPKQKTQKQTPRSRASAAQVLLSLQASGFVVTFLVLIVAGVVILSPTLRVLAEQQQEIANLEAALAESEQQVVALEEQRERWKDPAFVETQARERLLFVYPGDITYLVIDDAGTLEDDTEWEVSTGIIEAQTDWRESLLASYLVAATTSQDYQVEITQSDDSTTDPERIPSPELESTP
ncbi:MAG: septum formation initiator family protein [Pontimonas sp.]|nr:septum formation initiator family protein [Pontimonas sp.]